MSKKKKKLYTTQHKETNKPLVIDQNKLNRQKVYYSVDFRTGRYMTDKDRPSQRYKAKGVNLYDI